MTESSSHRSSTQRNKNQNAKLKANLQELIKTHGVDEFVAAAVEVIEQQGGDHAGSNPPGRYRTEEILWSYSEWGRRIYWFAYERNPKVDFQTRDGAAYAELLGFLALPGWRYEAMLMQFEPEPHATKKPIDGVIDDETVWNCIRSHDLVVMTTRPPFMESGTKAIRRSYTFIEHELFDALHPDLFRACYRDLVELNSDISVHLESPYERWGHIKFFQHRKDNRDFAKLHKVYDPVKRRWYPVDGLKTAAYAVYLPKVGELGFSALIVFGLSGDDTLRWSHLLVHNPDLQQRLKQMLTSDEERLLMAELSTEQNVHEHGISQPYSEVVKKWKPTVILDVAHDSQHGWIPVKSSIS